MAFWQDDGMQDHSRIPAHIKRPEGIGNLFNVDEKGALISMNGIQAWFWRDNSPTFIPKSQTVLGVGNLYFGGRLRNGLLTILILELSIRVVSFDSGNGPAKPRRPCRRGCYEPRLLNTSVQSRGRRGMLPLVQVALIRQTLHVYPRTKELSRMRGPAAPSVT